MKIRIISALLVFGLFSVLVLSAAPLGAAPPSLPPRPTIAPSPPSPSDPGWDDPRGGYIELRARVSNPSGLGSVVQWQDVVGTWHDVDSWRGEFDDVREGVGHKTWWLDYRLFGAPNFRWVVYEKATGQILAPSAVFTMPNEDRHTVRMEVAVP